MNQISTLNNPKRVDMPLNKCARQNETKANTNICL